MTHGVWTLAVGVWAAGCAGNGPAGVTTSAEDTAPDPPDSGDDPAPVDTVPGPWDGPSHLALPFAVVGDAAPRAAFPAPDGASITTDGPFDAVLVEGEARVTFTGALDTPSLASGALTLGLPDGAHVVTLAAVIGDRGLGTTTWVSDGWGQTAWVTLPSAPNARGDTPWDDASVWIAAPPSFSGSPAVNAVTHLHGFRAQMPATAQAQALAPLLAASGRDAVLIAPQGPVAAASGDFGQLMDAGGHAALVRDVVSVLYRDGLIDHAAIGAQVLTAHSGGYEAAAAMLGHGDLPVSAVHLFDALYAAEATFEAFASEGGLLRSNFTTWGGTADNNLAAIGWFGARGVPVGPAFTDDALATERVIIAETPSSHDRCMRDERAFARWLTWSGLPFGADAAPELRSVVQVADGALVRWLPDGDAAARVQIEGSDDGAAWEVLGVFAGEAATVPVRRQLRLRLIDGARSSGPSDTYGLNAGPGPRWLVVDGFDRVLDGSFTAPRHDFAARITRALDLPADTASNEAVARGQVDLGAYDGVLWLLGDESTADQTFDAEERAALAGYGGHLILSGSEVGYATDPGWLVSVTGAALVSDDAGTTTLVGGRTFGHAYPEDYPDVLTGAEVVWRYDTGGAAAVRRAHVGVVGFPLETMTDAELPDALAELVAAIR